MSAQNCPGCDKRLGHRNKTGWCLACQAALPCAADPTCTSKVKTAGLCALHHYARANAGKTCASDGCTAEPRTRGFCATHYEHERVLGRTCTATGCTRPERAKGLCDPHYNEARNAGKTCAVDRCTARVETMGLCSNHYNVALNAGKVCASAGCTAAVVDSGLCSNHNRHRRNEGRVCLADECEAKAFATGLCQVHYLSRTPETTQRWEANQRKRRANTVCLWVESYTTAAVLARTESLCHLCAEEIDPTAPATWDEDRRGWHVDHVIPLSLGGPDCLDNAAATHQGCNNSKIAKLGSLDADLDTVAVAAYEHHHGHAFAGADAVWPCTEPCKLVDRARTDPTLHRYAVEIGILASDPIDAWAFATPTGGSLTVADDGPEPF